MRVKIALEYLKIINGQISVDATRTTDFLLFNYVQAVIKSWTSNMPRVKAKIISHRIEDGKLMVLMQFNERIPKIATIVTVKWGAVRSREQNALYWTYLTWLIEHGGLKDQGHFSPDALHLDLKAYFLSEKVMDKGQFKAIEEGTTTDLNKSEFSEYMTKVGGFMREFFKVDDSAFWGEVNQEEGHDEF